MPEKLITYTQKFTVYRTDGDHLGHVKLGALLRYAQQVATAHAEAVGLDDALYRKTHTAYVLAKLALHVTRLPRVDEELTLVTQPERCKRAVNKRITHFYDADGAEVATMDSRWVLIDTEKRMILRKHPEQFDDQWAEDVPLELPMTPAPCCTRGLRDAGHADRGLLPLRHERPPQQHPLCRHCLRRRTVAGLGQCADFGFHHQLPPRGTPRRELHPAPCQTGRGHLLF